MSPAPSPLGSFEEQVLLSILHASDDAYGMRVRQELEELTGRDVAIGAVYATLDRLEAKGLVDSRRRVEDGLSRRRFVVTRAGLRNLADTQAMRDRLWRGVNLPRLLAAAR